MPITGRKLTERKRIRVLCPVIDGLGRRVGGHSESIKRKQAYYFESLSGASPAGR
jgi:hypothetical protein